MTCLLKNILCTLALFGMTVHISCPEAQADKARAAIKAAKVKYSSANSGLSAKSVQQALDQIGTGLKAFLRAAADKSGQSTVILKGKTYASCEEATLSELDNTTSFTPSSEDEGTWVSNNYSVFHGAIFCEEEFADLYPSGNYSGKYKIIGNAIVAFDVQKPDGTKFAVGKAVEPIIRDGKVFIRADSQSVTELAVSTE